MIDAPQPIVSAPPRSLLQKALRFAMILPGLGAQAMLFGIFGADLPYIAAYYGGGADGQFIASMALTSSALGLLLGGWISGWLLQRLGFKTFLAGALVGLALTASCAAFINDATLLIASRIAAGVCASFLTTISIALVPILHEEKDRSSVFGYQIAFGGALSALSFVVAGALIDTGDWRTPLYLFFPVFLLALALVPLMPKREPRLDTDAPADRGDLRAVAVHWQFFLLAAILPILVIIGSAELPLFVQQNGSLSSFQASTMLGLSALLISVAALFYGALSRRLGPDRLLQISLAVVAAALTILAAFTGLAALVIGAAMLGLGVGPIAPYLNDAAVRRSEVGGALVIGVYVTFASLGTFINPIVFSPLVSAWGLRGAFLCIAGALAVIVCISVLAGVGRRPIAQPIKA